MVSTDISSQTLSTIVSIKFEELSSRHKSFEDAKAQLLKVVRDEPDQHEKVRILLSRVEELPLMGKRTISLKNISRFLGQARTDPSVTLSNYKKSAKLEMMIMKTNIMPDCCTFSQLRLS